MAPHFDDYDDQLALPHFEDRLWDELVRWQLAETGATRRRRPALPVVAAAAASAVVLAGGAFALTRDSDKPEIKTGNIGRSVTSGPTGPTTTVPSWCLEEDAEPVIQGLSAVGATTSTVPTDSTSTTSAIPPDTTTTVPVDPAAVAEALDAEAATTATAPPGQDPACEIQPPAPENDPIPATEVPADAIVYVEQVNADGTVDRRWADETTGRYRSLQLDAAGNPLLDSAWLDIDYHEDGTAAIAERYVDYEARTYEDRTWQDPSGGQFRTDWREDFVIRKGLANGGYVEDGTEVVDGRELLRLIDALYGQADPELGVTWVELGSYRPIKRSGYPGSDAAYTQTTQYLPRTPENLALLDPVIPEGFTPE